MAKSLTDKLDRFRDQLTQALGDNLVSLLLFGPVTRDHASGTGDDARILLIVRDASPGALRPAEPLIAEWAHRGKSPPLIFSDTEWRASTDVFPIEIEDMREAHRLLAGSDPFEDLETTRDDLRRELEREIRGKLLHLRTDYAAMATNGSALSKGPSAIVHRLTWDGHEFLDSVRDPTVWAKVTKRLKKVGGFATVDVIKTLGIAVIKDQLGGNG